jgi:hypothetical protein
MIAIINNLHDHNTAARERRSMLRANMSPSPATDDRATHEPFLGGLIFLNGFAVHYEYRGASRTT